ncbi:hypothetical protein CCO03_05865 [Comamonas serinivorans]|uniref:Uncharacterized protein n=1 Tax=Comamonas serinivorans TaxID=1082851 RepID=A0A1Y0ELI9_9BURK|nr:hypothetical protein CCO03_05865 [Comamonas serinivorans]
MNRASVGCNASGRTVQRPCQVMPQRGVTQAALAWPCGPLFSATRTVTSAGLRTRRPPAST